MVGPARSVLLPPTGLPLADVPGKCSQRVLELLHGASGVGGAVPPSRVRVDVDLRWSSTVVAAVRPLAPALARQRRPFAASCGGCDVGCGAGCGAGWTCAPCCSRRRDGPCDDAGPSWSRSDDGCDDGCDVGCCDASCGASCRCCDVGCDVGCDAGCDAGWTCVRCCDVGCDAGCGCDDVSVARCCDGASVASIPDANVGSFCVPWLVPFSFQGPRSLLRDGL